MLLSLSQFLIGRRGKRERKKKPLVIKRKTALAISIHGEEKTPPAALSSLRTLRDVDDDPCFSFQFLLVALIYITSPAICINCFFFLKLLAGSAPGGFHLLLCSTRRVSASLASCWYARKKQKSRSSLSFSSSDYLCRLSTFWLARSLCVCALSKCVNATTRRKIKQEKNKFFSSSSLCLVCKCHFFPFSFSFPAFLNGLRNESRDVAVSQLLHYLPLLRPANSDGVRGYIHLLPG